MGDAEEDGDGGDVRPQQAQEEELLLESRAVVVDESELIIESKAGSCSYK